MKSSFAGIEKLRFLVVGTTARSMWFGSRMLGMLLGLPVLGWLWVLMAVVLVLGESRKGEKKKGNKNT